jgi:hypothetical protein
VVGDFNDDPHRVYCDSSCSQRDVIARQHEIQYQARRQCEINNMTDVYPCYQFRDPSHCNDQAALACADSKRQR